MVENEKADDPQNNGNKLYDIAIIGGGINGAGIARDAAGRGLKTLLLEAKDLAQATSSASTKLIHGGLRYLEYYEFGLVRKALKERETLLNLAPHIIWPLEFILPHNRNLRPKWMIRAGLFLYDHLAPRKKLPPSRGLPLDRDDPYGGPLNPDITYGFSYADCWVEDSRLVILNALDAHERGADIKTREPCKALSVNDDSHWEIVTPKGKYEARKLVNAAGPWVDTLLEETGLSECRKDGHKVRLVKGSHVVVPKIYDGDHCYILQMADNRIVFVIPYEYNYSLIGTTDVDYDGDVYSAGISDEEIAYLCNAVTQNFRKAVLPEDIVWSYSGVRPLLDEGGEEGASALTRDYKFVKTTVKGAPILSIYGGKITTYRTLAEQVMRELGHDKKWTHGSPLPGGNIENADFKSFYDDLRRKYDWMNKNTLHRLARAYGMRIERILNDVKEERELGTHFGDGVFQAEIDYLCTREWAQSLQDILYRRSKLGLHISGHTRDKLENYLND